jgi:TorA maturation chaperone TorD
MFLRAHEFSYGLFQKLLGNEPVKDLLSVAFAKESRDILALFAEESAELRGELEGLFEQGTAFLASPEDFLYKAKQEYMVMFIGPDKLVAPPWESVYVSAEPLLFQESTLEVRRIYQKEHYIPQGYPSIADDHIALQLDFLVKLVEREESAVEKEDLAECERLLEVRTNFINKHMLNWIPALVVAAQSIKEPVFYPQLLKVVLEFLKLDAAASSDLPTPCG